MTSEILVHGDQRITVCVDLVFAGNYVQFRGISYHFLTLLVRYKNTECLKESGTRINSNEYIINS